MEDTETKDLRSREPDSRRLYRKLFSQPALSEERPLSRRARIACTSEAMLSEADKAYRETWDLLEAYASEILAICQAIADFIRFCIQRGRQL